MNIQELMEEASSLPLEERARLVDSLLRSLNPPESEIDQEWAVIAQQRLDQVQSGETQAVSGEAAFGEIWKRLGR